MKKIETKEAINQIVKILRSLWEFKQNSSKYTQNVSFLGGV
jgi:hypothetical protein